MTLTVKTNTANDCTYVWHTGDEVADLEYMIAVLAAYAQELKKPATVAQMPQLPIETPKP